MEGPQKKGHVENRAEGSLADLTLGTWAEAAGAVGRLSPRRCDNK